MIKHLFTELGAGILVTYILAACLFFVPLSIFSTLDTKQIAASSVLLALIVEFIAMCAVGLYRLSNKEAE